MSGPLGFLASNTHLAKRNPKFRTEIDPECGEYLFFGLHLNLGAKFQTEIELLSLTELLKNISPPRNLLNQQKIDAYVYCIYLCIPYLNHFVRICKRLTEEASKLSLL